MDATNTTTGTTTTTTGTPGKRRNSLISHQMTTTTTTGTPGKRRHSLMLWSKLRQSVLVRSNSGSLVTTSLSSLETTMGEILRVPEDCLTLNEAIDKARQDRKIHIISVNEGRYKITKDVYGYNCLVLDFPIEIVGRGSKTKTILIGGIRTEKHIHGDVILRNFTVRHLDDHGVYGESSFTVENVIIEQCGGAGVWAYGTMCKAICKDAIIRYCGWSGVIAYDGATVTLMGSKTKVYRNCMEDQRETKRRSVHYGLSVWYSSFSRILLMHPLTKEKVSINNEGPCSGSGPGGSNWGVGDCNSKLENIETIQNPHTKEQTTLLVPEECSTLEEAVKVARKNHHIQTISIDSGEYTIMDTDKNGHHYLNIDFRIDIVGRRASKSNKMTGIASGSNKSKKIIILGGIKIKPHIEETVGFKNITVRHLEDDGIVGYSRFTVEDVIIEQCNGVGMWVEGESCVVVCKNIEIRQCKSSGLDAVDGANVTFMGKRTSIHDNCTNGQTNEYGLNCGNCAYSKILFVHPLTKETAVVNNGGGGNWGNGGGSGADGVDDTALNIQNIRL